MKRVIIITLAGLFTAAIFFSCSNDTDTLTLAVRDSLAKKLSREFNNGVSVTDVSNLVTDGAKTKTFQVIFDIKVLAERKVFLNPSASYFIYSEVGPASGTNTPGWYDSLSKGESISLIGMAYVTKENNGWYVSNIEYQKIRK